MFILPHIPPASGIKRLFYTHAARVRPASTGIFKFIPRGDSVELHFDHAAGGVEIRGGGSGFEVAGEDGIFYPAAKPHRLQRKPLTDRQLILRMDLVKFPAYAENPSISWEEVQSRCGANRWPGPMGCINPFRPAGLYECMLKRVMPYTLRGFLYYQGESDDHKPLLYDRLPGSLSFGWISLNSPQSRITASPVFLTV